MEAFVGTGGGGRHRQATDVNKGEMANAEAMTR